MYNNSISARLVTKTIAAEYVGVGTIKFTELVDTGVMPKPIYLSERKIMWDKKDLDAAIESLKISAESG
jgi:predicted DNA-binding transcriptional regulator AlpA